jgi:hypothetical protein
MPTGKPPGPKIYPEPLEVVGIVWHDANDNFDMDDGVTSYIGPTPVQVTLTVNGVQANQLSGYSDGFFRFVGVPDGNHTLQVPSTATHQNVQLNLAPEHAGGLISICKLPHSGLIVNLRYVTP